MNVGIVCYASVGGSGIVATELAKSLAARGHDVHLVSTEPPFRYSEYQPGLSFHRVHTPAYPLFREPQYVLSLANKIVHVTRDYALDIIHAHYAVPHATAAYLARQILLATTPLVRVPQVITTLHGTDITLVGSDHSYSETVAFSIDRSDGVTAVSESLRADTYRALQVHQDIRVIPNFLDCRVHRRQAAPSLRERYGRGYEKLAVHVSNFRPVKRPEVLIQVFARIAARVRCRLLLVGDGPELGRAVETARTLGVAEHVECLGEQDQILPLLSISDLFLLTSQQESFGLAALEAMAAGVPVVASDVGGLREVIDHGRSGFLHGLNDIDGMAASGIDVLSDADLHARVAAEGVRTVRARFCADLVVPKYEAFYRELLEQRNGLRAREA